MNELVSIRRPVARKKIGGAKSATSKTDQRSVSSAGNGHVSNAAHPDFKLIAWKDLALSPTNPRRRIDEGTIASLADSIRSQGILEPLIVRSRAKKFEVVCGERRYRAAAVAAVTKLPCLVRELSDEEVLDIQIHENLHREDVHPMDEAYGYQFLKEKLGCDVKELALRVGKSEGYVLNRLKLNQLVKEAREDIDAGHLPLTYALEIAKYTPDIQKLIYGEVYRKEGKYQKDRYIQVPIKGQMVPWKVLVEWINTNIHRLLSKAPFDTKATDLRPDGLACINCPERTGVSVSLFEPNQIGKKDACLNPACFRLKSENHVEMRRLELAAASGIDPSEIPLVRSWCYSDGNGYLGTESAAVISGVNRGRSTRKCNKAVSAIDIEPDNFGQTVQVCLKASGCKIHWPASKASKSLDSSTGKPSEDEVTERLEAHRSRREEIWNAKVAEAVRIRVFKQAAEEFEKKFTITGGGAGFLPQMVARFWRMTASGDSQNLNGVIKQLLAEWSRTSHDGKAAVLTGTFDTAWARNLKQGMQARLLFLLVHAHKGTIGYGNNYASQMEVRELAKEFKVDYAIIDAEVRLEFCAKKHKPAHQIYLEAVQAKKKDAVIPRLFSDKWKAA